MSGILEQLVAVVTRNNELLEQAAAGREKVLTAVDAATTAKPKAAAAKPAVTEPKLAETPAETPPAAAAGDDEFTIDIMKTEIGAYIGHEREDERKARSVKVSELFKKVGAAKASDITEPKFVKAVIKAIRTLTDQGEITTATAVEEAEPDLMA